ncbi:MAG TPA: hypothetical protein VN721_10880 [Flavipsychrobacter sp.]|nr:hypothetical protein [Flavipsychrobacter sp.]
MDVAKYIGLFLLKNHFCYVHGLGNLELRKKPAAYNGEVLQSAEYEVVLTPSGSIDDNLANFIATNEQISISKASNALRDFSSQAKGYLHEGREVDIPAIGKFVEYEGRVLFVTDPNLQFTPPSIPAMRTARREPEAINTSSQGALYESGSSKGQGSNINWGRVILAVVIFVIIVAGAFYGYKYLRNRNTVNPQPAVVAPIHTDTVVQQPKAIVPDTIGNKVDSTALATANMIHYKVELDGYDNRKRAEKRVSQMRSFGHNVDMIVKDSTTFLIVMPISTYNKDTTKVLDSLSALFNPSGVTVYQE